MSCSNDRPCTARGEGHVALDRHLQLSTGTCRSVIECLVCPEAGDESVPSLQSRGHEAAANGGALWLLASPIMLCSTLSLPCAGALGITVPALLPTWASQPVQ